MCRLHSSFEGGREWASVTESPMSAMLSGLALWAAVGKGGVWLVDRYFMVSASALYASLF